MADEVSYRERNCTDQARIEQFLTRSRVGLLGLGAEEYPYVVPLNYVWHDGHVLFHGMGSGRKIDLLGGRPAVSFVVFTEYGTVDDPVPCHADTAYFSVMIFGRAERIDDPAQAAEALQRIVDKFAPGRYDHPITPTLAERYRSGLDGRPVGVYRIVPERLTAKQNLPDGLPAPEGAAV